MEDYNDIAITANNKKRVRDDSEDSHADSPESKLTRVESVDSDGNSFESELGRDGNLHETKDIQVDLLDILDDADTVYDRDPAIQGLDSVIKSFEEEILVPASAPLEGTSDSGDSQPELGYLMEASDDDLGLPPSFSAGDEQGIGAFDLEPSASGAVGFGEMLGFEDHIPTYDSFDFGIAGDSDNSNSRFNNDNINDFVTLGGLFDYSDGAYEPADISELTWQPESLSAL